MTYTLEKPMISTRLKALLLIVLMGSGCSSGPSPEEIAARYFEAFRTGDATASHAMLCEADRVGFSETQYAEMNGLREPMLVALSAGTSYSVKGLSIDGDRAVATVEVGVPDVSSLMGELMAAALTGALGGAGDEHGSEDAGNKMIEDLAQKIKIGGLPTIKSTRDVTLLREKDGWCLFADLKSEAERHATAEKVGQLVSDANALEASGDLAAALSKYDEALALEPAHVEGSSRRIALSKTLAKRDEGLAYLPSLELRRVKVSDSVLGRKGAFGEVKNNGDKTLHEVEITIYCLDKAGATVWETDYTPVRVSEWSFGDTAKPLKPNYSRKFGVRLDDAPSDWGGKIRVEVTGAVLAPE